MKVQCTYGAESDHTRDHIHKWMGSMHKSVNLFFFNVYYYVVELFGGGGEGLGVRCMV